MCGLSTSTVSISPAASITSNSSAGVISGFLKRSRIRRMAATARASSSAIVSAMKASADFASIFRSERTVAGKSKVFRYDHCGLRLGRCSNHVVIAGIGQTRRNWQEVVKIRNHGVFKGSFHAGARPLCARRRILKALAAQNFFNSCFGFIQDAARPAKAEKFRLRQGEQQVPFERARKRARIDECGETIRKQAYRCSASSSARFASALPRFSSRVRL